MNASPVSSHRATSRSSAAGWAAMLAIGIFVVLVAGTPRSVGVVLVGAATHLVVGGICVVWAVVGYRRVEWRSVGELGPWIAVSLAVMAVSAVLSPVPRIAAAGLLGALGAAAAYCLLGSIAAHPWMGARLRAALVVLPIGVAIAYVASVGAEWIGFWELTGALSVPPLRPSFTALSFGSPNYAATLVVGLTPFAAMTLVSRHRSGLAFAAGALALAAVALTGSRAGLTGGAAAVALVLVVTLRRRATFDAATHRRWLVAAAVTFAVVALAIGQRLAQGGVSDRLEFWRISLLILADQPVLGGGPGTWALLSTSTSDPLGRGYAVASAHSLYFTTLAEVGALGALAALAIVVAAVRVMVLRIRSPDASVGLPALGAAAGLLAVAIQSVADAPTIWPAFALPMIALLAVTELNVGQGRPPRRYRVPRFGWMAGWLVLSITLTPALIRMDTAWVYAEAARAAADEDDWQSARQDLGAAASLDSLPTYRSQLAIAESYGGDLKEALRLLDEVIPVDGLPHHRIARAQIRMELGMLEGAAEDIRKAYARSSGDAVAMMNISWIAERVGDRELALDAAAAAIAAAPPLAADPWWDSADREVPKALIIDAAAAKAATSGHPGHEAIVRAYAGDVVGAVQAASRLAGSRSSAVRAIVSAIATPTPAGLAEVRAYVSDHPRDWFAASWLSILLRDVDPTGSFRYARLAFSAQADSARNYIDMPRRIGVDLEGRQFRLFGSPSNAYGRRTLNEILPAGSIGLAP